MGDTFTQSVCSASHGGTVGGVGLPAPRNGNERPHSRVPLFPLRPKGGRSGNPSLFPRLSALSLAPPPHPTPPPVTLTLGAPLLPVGTEVNKTTCRVSLEWTLVCSGEAGARGRGSKLPWRRPNSCFLQLILSRAQPLPPPPQQQPHDKAHPRPCSIAPL